MKLSSSTILFALLGYLGTTVACPYSNTGDEMPGDATHTRLRRRRLASLTEDAATRGKIEAIISERKRSLQSTCVSTAIVEEIRVALQGISNAITDAGDRGHFIGGIVRLAAHDFMDFDINSPDDALGSDGCLDFEAGANAGLPSIWCDGCQLTALYNVYSDIMSRADFWVLAANAVIKNASPNQDLDLPFRLGRIDSNTCASSTARLPEPSSCDDVESAFITRMGLSWRDAVALLGAHTLGRGHDEFSGHPGTWVQNNDESVIFDKQFYTEVVNRGWRPRELDGTPDNDWTWGGRNRGVMMLNTDICLRFDIDNVIEAPCCTNTNQDCRDDTVQNIQCEDSSAVRPEAFAAFNEFEAGRGGDNAAFFAAYSEAWAKATENGYDSLNDLVDTCDPTVSPTPSPTPDPTIAPTPSPVPEVTGAPTPSPVPEVTGAPTPSPVPTSGCEDLDSFIDRRGKTRTCNWVFDKMKCGKYSAECPVTCNSC